MSDYIDSIKAELWKKMSSKEYRHAFVSANLSTTIAAQIQTLRECRADGPWTQKDLAEKSGMAQARISLMENPSYDKYTFSTLKRIAAALDVAFIARFVPFSELVAWSADVSPEKIAVPEFALDSIWTKTSAARIAGTLNDEKQQRPRLPSIGDASSFERGSPIGGIPAYTPAISRASQQTGSLLCG